MKDLFPKNVLYSIQGRVTYNTHEDELCAVFVYLRVCWA